MYNPHDQLTPEERTIREKKNLNVLIYRLLLPMFLLVLVAYLSIWFMGTTK